MSRAAVAGEGARHASEGESRNGPRPFPGKRARGPSGLSLTRGAHRRLNVASSFSNPEPFSVPRISVAVRNCPEKLMGW